MANGIVKHKHAIVIGGSMAGLLAARALSDSFEKVTILERDPVHPEPESRKGQPQTRHVHGLLAQGLTIFNEFFPGIGDEMMAAGALGGDTAQYFHWYHYGGFRLQFHSDLFGMTMSRPFLEFHIRRRTLALPNIILIDCCSVTALITSPDKQKVLGVQVNRQHEESATEPMLADMVVDASGRGSSTPRWLESLGYERPHETEVKIRVSYATREYRRIKTETDKYPLEMLSATAPAEKRGAFLFPIEGNRWILTAGSYLGDQCPATPEGLTEYIRTLPSSHIYDVISKTEPLSDVFPYKYPASLRRHYEKMQRFPENYLVMGDAAGSMNPIYGQGMTSAAMQSKVLQRTVQQATLQGIWKNYFKTIARVIDIPWQLAVGEDFRYPETEGTKPPFVDVLNAYVAKAHRATHHDPVVYKQFLLVMNLMAPPASLMSPAIFWRVMFKG